MKLKTVEVEYIESGAFQGGEEATSKAKIEYGETCFVIKKEDLRKLKTEALASVALLEFAVLVLKGCQQGNVTSKPLMIIDPKATEYEMKSLTEMAQDVIIKATRK